MPEQPRRVVILYGHPMLGEGIARLLGESPDFAVELVHVDTPEVAAAALAGAPDVVIIERCSGVDAMELLRVAPSALVVDVGLDAGPSWTIRRDRLSPDPDDLVRAIADRLHSEPPPTLPAQSPTATS